MATPTPEPFLAESRRYLAEVYLPAIRRAVEPLTEEQVWWRPGEESNSIGNLLLHLTGNLRQWILSGIGGAPDDRVRQAEFDTRGGVPREAALAGLVRAVADAVEVLGSLGPEVLAAHRTIQGRDTVVFGAVYHVVEHFSGHTAQIVWISKALRGEGTGWPAR